MFFLPVFDIDHNRDGKSQYKKHKGKNIHSSLTYIQSSHGVYKKFQVRGRHVIYAQFYSYLPVPFCAWAESVAIPYSQDEPGKSCQRQCYKIGQTCFLPHPSEKIKNYPGRMKNKKEFV